MTPPTIEFCREQQRRAAMEFRETGDILAALGFADWRKEEHVMRQEGKWLTYISFCSGIEAATVAWHPLQWSPLAFCEIDKFPSRVLAHHYPDVPNLGDFTQGDWSQFTGRADICVGGTPCQSFSFAGLRRSLADDRGNLSLEFIRAVNTIRPRFVVWEKVPGVLSTKDNAFGCFLAGLVGAQSPLLPTTKRGRWPSSGMVIGPERSAAWRILDAQYFGLAQRRKRVFVVSCPRGGADPFQVLFEPVGLQRYSAPSRKAWEKDPSNAGSGVVGSLCARDSKTVGSQFVNEGKVFAVPMAFTWQSASCFSSTVNLAGTLIKNQTYAVAFSQNTAVSKVMTINMQGSKGNCDIGEDDIAPTLIKMHGHDVHAVAFAQNTRDEVRLIGGDGSLVGALAAESGMKQTNYVAVPDVGLCLNAGGMGRIDFESETLLPCIGVDEEQNANEELMGTLKARREGGGQEAFVAHGFNKMAVRRLTPVECERLQGFPDGHTDIPGASDSSRYKALGNSMAVPVMRWIGQRIQKAIQEANHAR